MIQQEFATRAAAVCRHDPSVIGLAVAGSWLSDEIDEYSDLDLILVTHEKVSHNKNTMLVYANRFGKLISAFTGEHVGEPRVLICLFDDPLLHVDIKFLTLEEFCIRIENPVILADTDGSLQRVLETTEGKFPYPDYQWIEDRFWTWIHYALLKIGRGEYFEAFDFFGFIRMMVLGPLLHIKNGNLPRGVRKGEQQLGTNDLDALKSTLAGYDRGSLLDSLENSVNLYRLLRDELFDKSVVQQKFAEEKVMEYFENIKRKDQVAGNADH